MDSNPILFFTVDIVQFFEKPYFDGQKWHDLTLHDDEVRFFLTESRCAMLHVEVSQDEEPVGYIHSVYGRGRETYIPVYDRSNMVEKDLLYPNEVITNK